MIFAHTVEPRKTAAGRLQKVEEFLKLSDMERWEILSAALPSFHAYWQSIMGACRCAELIQDMFELPAGSKLDLDEYEPFQYLSTVTLHLYQAVRAEAQASGVDLDRALTGLFPRVGVPTGADPSAFF